MRRWWKPDDIDAVHDHGYYIPEHGYEKYPVGILHDTYSLFVNVLHNWRKDFIKCVRTKPSSVYMLEFVARSLPKLRSTRPCRWCRFHLIHVACSAKYSGISGKMTPRMWKCNCKPSPGTGKRLWR